MPEECGQPPCLQMPERVHTCFSITPSGFEPAVQRQSCLPCETPSLLSAETGRFMLTTLTLGRRKKKRCDGCRPCGLCRNSNGRDECTWPAERRTRRTRRPSNNPNVPLQPREICKTGSPGSETSSQRSGPISNSVTLLESLLKSLP